MVVDVHQRTQYLLASGTLRNSPRRLISPRGIDSLIARDPKVIPQLSTGLGIYPYLGPRPKTKSTIHEPPRRKNPIATNMASEASACKVVLASAIAKGLLREVSDSLETLQRSPLLIGFLANDDPAARKYAEWTQRTCKER